LDGFSDTLCFFAGMNGTLWSLSLACSTTFLLFGAWCCFEHHCRSFIDATGSEARWLVGVGCAVLLLVYGATSINALGSFKRMSPRHTAARTAAFDYEAASESEVRR
jgi:hypothetical protein